MSLHISGVFRHRQTYISACFSVKLWTWIMVSKCSSTSVVLPGLDVTMRLQCRNLCPFISSKISSLFLISISSNPSRIIKHFGPNVSRMPFTFLGVTPKPPKTGVYSMITFSTGCPGLISFSDAKNTIDTAVKRPFAQSQLIFFARHVLP